VHRKYKSISTSGVQTFTIYDSKIPAKDHRVTAAGPIQVDHRGCHEGGITPSNISNIHHPRTRQVHIYQVFDSLTLCAICRGADNLPWFLGSVEMRLVSNLSDLDPNNFGSDIILLPKRTGVVATGMLQVMTILQKDRTLGTPPLRLPTQ